MMNEVDTSTTSCYTNNNMYVNIGENLASESQSNSLLYDLSLLKEKVHNLESVITVLITPENNHQHGQADTSMAMSSIGTLVQEVIVTASSMMFTCQQMGMLSDTNGDQNLQWYDQTIYNHNNSDTNLENSSVPQNISIYGNITEIGNMKEHAQARRNEAKGGLGKGISINNYDIIELQASDILAKYTHYCQVCGKGFKRDANLRMHMRAHGDEYKSPSALSNPIKKASDGENHVLSKLPKKYSCPQEGCRWNRKHVKFTPLKSMICVKNHYKRSHCPKMYVCKRCSSKNFSVLSDLRTHEKHCGDLKWLCSCGTTFSRKDKLMGHVALFVGHVSAVN